MGGEEKYLKIAAHVRYTSKPPRSNFFRARNDLRELSIRDQTRETKFPPRPVDEQRQIRCDLTQIPNPSIPKRKTEKIKKIDGPRRRKRSSTLSDPCNTPRARTARHYVLVYTSWAVNALRRSNFRIRKVSRCGEARRGRGTWRVKVILDESGDALYAGLSL